MKNWKPYFLKRPVGKSRHFSSVFAYLGQSRFLFQCREETSFFSETNSQPQENDRRLDTLTEKKKDINLREKQYDHRGLPRVILATLVNQDSTAQENKISERIFANKRKTIDLDHDLDSCSQVSWYGAKRFLNRRWIHNADRSGFFLNFKNRMRKRKW